MEPGTWYATKDEENWNDLHGFETEAQAVAEAPAWLGLGPGQKFWVGQATKPPMPLDAANIHAWLESAAGDDGCPDDILPYEISEDASRELNELLTAWSEKHDVKPLWVGFEDVSAHTVPA